MRTNTRAINVSERAAGILLHPTSLPGPADHGDFGPHAYYFIKFLADCGVRIWQTLPLGPTHADLSPYNCKSAHAGNPLLISGALLHTTHWIDESDCTIPRRAMLIAARHGFERYATSEQRADFAEFTDQFASWLEDYALYQVLRNAQGGIPWYDWPAELRDRNSFALHQARRNLNKEIDQIRFEQFVFFHQWTQLRNYAHEHRVRVFGDMAIFVAHDSADVWAHRDCFQLNEHGQPIVVAGVPPDYFSPTGQRWGNPLYDWRNNEDAVIDLWVARMQSQARLFDLIRIDHFRGLESHWEIPATASAPSAGHWVLTPGDKLLNKLREQCGDLLWIAEDLGFITEEVDQLRRRHNLPGMHVLQFGFDGDPQNRHQIHAHHPENIVYTGTHDNDTTLGWFNSLPTAIQEQVMSYFGYPAEPMPWPLVRAAMASVAQFAILPMQDILGLDSTHRMNIPGIADGNWKWRFKWDQVPAEIANRLAHFTWRYGRNLDDAL